MRLIVDGVGVPLSSGVSYKNSLSPVISTHLATSSLGVPASPFDTCFCQSSSSSFGSAVVPSGFMQIHKLPLWLTWS